MSKRLTHLHRKPLRRSQYFILGQVGQGQFGQVFCAIHRQTGDLVALKRLDQQRFPTHKFLRELRFLLSLRHPNIVACQALEHTSTGRYLVMEYCEGGTLRDLLRSKVQLSLAQGLKLVADVLAGLEHAHSCGIIHCDIKPENILLNLSVTDWNAQISDFGIARLSQELGKESSGNIGSPAYMAPERFYGQYSPTSDLYAVGVILFELAVGHRPFSGLPHELRSAHLSQPIKIPNTVPLLLRSTISTALQKLPARRFASATEMLKSLRLAAEVEGLTQRATSSLSRSTLDLSSSSLNSTQQELLQAPVESLTVELQLVYQGNALQHSQPYASNALVESSLHEWRVQLTEPVQELIVRPQGCFVLTKSQHCPLAKYSIYCLPSAQAPITSNSNQSECSLASYQLLSLQCANLTIAIDPQGHWMAIAAYPGDGLRQCTEAIQEKDISTTAPQVLRQPGLQGNQTALQILKLPNLQPTNLPVSCQFPTQLIALNSRYGIATLNQQVDENAQEAGTILQVFTRRGSFIGSLTLPMRLQQVTTSATSRCQLLGVDQTEPTSALLIDLKPYKVFRISLEIAPALIAATCWGYILIDRQGKMILLDQDGKRSDVLELPAILTVMASHLPTAIAVSEDHRLLIATWSSNQSTLHTINLWQLNLNLFS